MPRIFFSTGPTTTNSTSGSGFWVEIETMYVASPRPVDSRRARAIATARRIKALAARPGTPAEGEAAKRALNRLMKAHGLKSSDL